jgi:DNA-binding response OmpR family regulator
MRFLLVEDDPMIGASLRNALRQEGHAVDWVRDGRAAQSTLASERFDLLLLDLGLPQVPGLEVLRGLRAAGNTTPAIVLTARDELEQRVALLDAGADDYLVKPFELAELTARIRAVLRRTEAPRDTQDREEGVRRFDGWTVSLPRRELQAPSGAVVDLTGAEFDLLVSLLDHAGRVIARERLIELSRTRMGDSTDRSVDVLVSRLRRKLTTEGSAPPIVTVRGVGYMFNTTVERS